MSDASEPALLVERDGQRFNLDVTLEARPQNGP